MSVYLFVIAGQSNALGFGMSLATLPENLVAPNPKAYIFGGAYWGGLQPGVNTGTPGAPEAWGPVAEFAYRFGVDHPNDTLLLVEEARGSTGLAADPTQLDWSPSSAGELFDTTDAKIDAAIAAYHAAHPDKPTPTVNGVLWMQGESDAADPVKAAAYETNLANLFSEIRAEWMDDPHGAIIFGRINDSAALAYDVDVRWAQLHVDDADPYAESFRTADFDMQADDLHYSAAGHVQLGDGFYNTWAF